MMVKRSPSSIYCAGAEEKETREREEKRKRFGPLQRVGATPTVKTLPEEGHDGMLGNGPKRV